MKKSIIHFLFASSGLLSSTSFAMQTYTVEVCSIPLNEIITDNNARESVASLGLQHVFVRGNNGSYMTGLNFEPQDKTQYLYYQSMIGNQDFPTAKCAILKQFEDIEGYNAEWSRFVLEYQEATKKYYCAPSNNCQLVTEGILQKLGYELPEEIAETLKQQSALLKITQNFSPELVQQAQQTINQCKQQ